MFIGDYKNLTENDIKECIAEKTGIELKNLSVDDKDKLKKLGEELYDFILNS